VNRRDRENAAVDREASAPIRPRERRRSAGPSLAGYVVCRIGRVLRDNSPYPRTWEVSDRLPDDGHDRLR
jgi:hypothetical protein